MHKEVMIDRIKQHRHRVRLWNLYKDLATRYPNKYKILYDHDKLSFHLFIKTRLYGWRPWAQSQSWRPFGNG